MVFIEKEVSREMETNKVSYSERINAISDALSSRATKPTLQKFLNNVVAIKNDYNTTLSTRFLKNLVVKSNKRNKARTILTFLKRTELKTTSRSRYYTEFNNNGKIKTKEILKFLVV